MLEQLRKQRQSGKKAPSPAPLPPDPGMDTAATDQPDLHSSTTDWPLPASVLLQTRKCLSVSQANQQVSRSLQLGWQDCQNTQKCNCSKSVSAPPIVA